MFSGQHRSWVVTYTSTKNKISRVEIMPSWWRWKDPRADWPWTEAQGRQMSFEKLLRAGSGSVSLMYISPPPHLIAYTPHISCVHTHTTRSKSPVSSALKKSNANLSIRSFRFVRSSWWGVTCTVSSHQCCNSALRCCFICWLTLWN